MKYQNSPAEEMHKQAYTEVRNTKNKARYRYQAGGVAIETPVKIKLPFKRKDVRSFVWATGGGHLLSKYNQARINNGSDVGNVGRFFAENPKTTMVLSNMVTGLGVAGKNAYQNHKQPPVKTAQTERSEFEKLASTGFLTSQETEERFLADHKPSDLKFVKLAFALEASGELDRIDDYLENGGRKILDDYLKVAYTVCHEGIEKEANAIRRGAIKTLSTFMSGGGANFLGSIPSTIAESAVQKSADVGIAKMNELANKGLDAGIDKAIDFENRMTAKKMKAAKAAQVNANFNNLSGMPKAASFSRKDAEREVSKIEAAFMDRDLQTKASIQASEFEKKAEEQQALDSLMGGKIASYTKLRRSIQAFDDSLADDDQSDIGLADEMKTASSEDPMEDTMEYAVTNLETNQPLDPMSNGEEDDENIWNEDPSDFVN